jgi:hypothetical protein
MSRFNWCGIVRWARPLRPASATATGMSLGRPSSDMLPASSDDLRRDCI